MSILALRLAGPLQSWAADSRHTRRGTLIHPTKSGVIGMLAAAAGIPRGGDLSELAALRLAVRIDQPGKNLEDFHTVSGASHNPNQPNGQRLPRADGGTLPASSSTKITRRFYRTDAVYTAYLQGNHDLLTGLSKAIRHPRFPVYLGRRSCPPSKPLLISVQTGTELDQALRETPWQAAEHHIRHHQYARHTTVDLTTVTEDETGFETLTDQPAPTTKAHYPGYTQRTVRSGYVTLPVPTPAWRTEPDTESPQAGEHDPFDLLDD